MFGILTHNGRCAAVKETCKLKSDDLKNRKLTLYFFQFRCNNRNTTTTTVTGTASPTTTEATTTTDGLVCEGFQQETGTRRIMVCPEDDEFCITLENKYVEFEEGPDGNATSDIAWNMTKL